MWCSDFFTITYFKLLLEAVNSLRVWRYSRILSQIGESWCSLPQLASPFKFGGTWTELWVEWGVFGGDLGHFVRTQMCRFCRALGKEFKDAECRRSKECQNF